MATHETTAQKTVYPVFFGQPTPEPVIRDRDYPPPVNAYDHAPPYWQNRPCPGTGLHPFKTLGDWWHGYDRHDNEVYCLELGRRGSLGWMYYELIGMRVDRPAKPNGEFNGTHFRWFIKHETPAHMLPEFVSPYDPKQDRFPELASFSTAEGAFAALVAHFDMMGWDDPFDDIPPEERNNRLAFIKERAEGWRLKPGSYYPPVEGDVYGFIPVGPDGTNLPQVEVMVLSVNWAGAETVEIRSVNEPDQDWSEVAWDRLITPRDR